MKKQQMMVTIWLFNIAMENPRTKWFYSWENPLFLWAIGTMAMLVVTRGYLKIGSHGSKPSTELILVRFDSCHVNWGSNLHVRLV